MQQQPFVSIIMPVRNGERWISAALESVFFQRWEHFEIIVVDDGSTDQTQAVIDRYRSPKLRMLHTAGVGAAAARNAALAVASGDYIQYLDADDIVGENKLSTQLAALAAANEETIASCAWAIFTDDPKKATFTPDLLWQDLQPVEWLIRAGDTGRYMPPHAWLTPRKVHDAAGPWNQSLVIGNDGEFFCRVLLQAGMVQFCPETKVLYRQGVANSLTNRRDARAMQSLIRSSELWCSHLRGACRDERTRWSCVRLLRRLYLRVARNTPELTPAVTAMMRALDEPSVPVEGSRTFKTAAAVLGWERAKQLQRRTHTLRALLRLTRSEP